VDADARDPRRPVGAGDATPPMPELEPVVGWRVWHLAWTPGVDPSLEPAGSGVDPWPPRRPAVARCAAQRLLTLGRPPHESPDPSCTCGIYAAHGLERFPRPTPAYPPPPVVGTASLWGRVIEHEHGWRAAFAYPARLRLVCALCAWLEPGTGDPAVIHTFADRAFPLCDRHAGGIQLADGRRTRPAPMSPNSLQATLLDAYAVDLLPPDEVRAWCRRAAPEAPPAYFPRIRGVPPAPHRSP
jgi:hypothetical protein